MIRALLSRIPMRFVFVVGKGGVGKTTTAGAVALALADNAESTHLISTDPAHSLGDLFEQDLSHGLPENASCNESLLLEEFAARKYADRLFARLRAPLLELIESGTYLDAADAAGFLDLSIPGIDEVMAALRLVELHESKVARVVVDTAPTGHTIRLLESARTIDSWVAAGRAMADKAGVVATHMVGSPVRFAAEDLLDQWASAAHRFYDDVLRTAGALVVTREGRVVAAETERLMSTVNARGLQVAATLGVGAGADVTVDFFGNARGCAGLREWTTRVRAGSAPSAPNPATSTAIAPIPEWVGALGQDLIWVAGKGGVGKSTCASALAVGFADQRSVLLVSTDPAGSLSEVLGTEITSTVREVAPNLFARQIDALSEFKRMREQYQKSIDAVFESIGLEGSATLDRKVLESLWDFAPPGIDEVISLLEIVEQRAAYDVLIVDSAPTGHFLRLIQLPEIALDWVHSLLRLIVKYGAIASLDALAHDLLAFAKRLRQLKLDLSTPGKSAVLVVTQAEPLVNAETTRLFSDLERAGVPVAAMILNRADDGPADLHAASAARTPLIRAPDHHGEVVGPAALRGFLAQWEIGT